MNKVKLYFRNLLIAIDQLVNAVFAGDPDETISSRLGKVARSGKRTGAYYFCKFLSLFDDRHCVKSIEEDEGKDQVL